MYNLFSLFITSLFPSLISSPPVFRFNPSDLSTDSSNSSKNNRQQQKLYCLFEMCQTNKKKSDPEFCTTSSTEDIPHIFQINFTEEANINNNNNNNNSSNAIRQHLSHHQPTANSKNGGDATAEAYETKKIFCLPKL